MSDDLAPIELDGAVAVVTGGASGIGKHIARALLGRGTTVVIADVEAPAIDTTLTELAEVGTVDGVVTDVTKEPSVAALADHVFDAYGRCNLLFNNAGVTSGGGGLLWQQEPNDFRWCFGVNVFGIGICTATFVPRMIESGAPGQVINTSSKDGGIAPVPTASVYAASKAAVSCLTESLHHQLVAQGTQIRASVLYPSGGLLDTGLYSAQRNRPAELARTGEATGRASMSFDELVDRVATATGTQPPIADLDELGEFVADCASRREFFIAKDLDDTAALLHRRADAIAAGEVPPFFSIGV